MRPREPFDIGHCTIFPAASPSLPRAWTPRPAIGCTQPSTISGIVTTMDHNHRRDAFTTTTSGYSPWTYRCSSCRAMQEPMTSWMPRAPIHSHRLTSWARTSAKDSSRVGASARAMRAEPGRREPPQGLPRMTRRALQDRPLPQRGRATRQESAVSATALRRISAAASTKLSGYRRGFELRRWHS